MATKKVVRKRRRRIVRRKKNHHNSAFIAPQTQEEAIETENNSFFGHQKSGSNVQGRTKYSFSSPSDPQEVEADLMAEKVMQINTNKEGGSFRSFTNGALGQNNPTDGIQLKCDDCQEEEKVHKMETEEEVNKMEEEEIDSKEEEEEEHNQIASKSVGNRRPNKATVPFTQGLKASKGKGSPLQPSTLNEMSSAFGYDFKGVRIHTSQQAESLSKEINAQAFANGKDVYFNQGKYNPATKDGKRLLAHELTHVIQQDKTVEDKQPTEND